jgi:ubiquinone/menaquinone biosynthesis C-methylase UbiE
MASPQQEIVTINERVTGPPGKEMLRLSNLAQKYPVEALDLGCGGGIITSKLLESPHDIKRIVAGDIDDQMLAIVTANRDSAIKNQPPGIDSADNNNKTKTKSSWPLVEVEKINQTSIPHPPATFTHVFNNFAIFFLPDDSPALAETYRVLEPSGGQAGFTSWKSIAWWAEVADPALAQHLPEAPKLPNPSAMFGTSGWSDEVAIQGKLEKAGFWDVKVSEFKFAPMIEAVPFARATALLVQSIAKRIWSEEDFGKFGGKIEDALLGYLKENFKDGVWDGEMTAIIALGTKE